MKHKVASLLTLAASLTALTALADPPPNTQQPNMVLVRRVRCVAAAYRVASTPTTPSVGMARMQPVSEGQFLQAFANTGECVGLDAQSALVLMRAQQATLVGGNNSGTPSGIAVAALPTLPTVPTLPPPPVAPTAVSVPGVTVQQPVTFVMQSADAGATAEVATDASTVTTTTTVTGGSVSHAARCPHGRDCSHGG